MSKNTPTNIIDEPSITTETNDTNETNGDLLTLVWNFPTVEPPPSNVPPRESEHSKLRCSDSTRHPPQHFAFDINRYYCTRKGGMLYAHVVSSYYCKLGLYACMSLI